MAVDEKISELDPGTPAVGDLVPFVDVLGSGETEHFLQTAAEVSLRGLSVTDGNFVVGDGANFVAENGATARNSLGVAIGSDVQAWDAQLDDLAGLDVSQNDNFIVADGANWMQETPAQVRTTLGLGTMALEAAADYVEIAGDTMTGALTVDGSADEVQLAVQMDAAQTSSAFKVTDSVGDLAVEVTSAGRLLIQGPNTPRGSDKAEIYVKADELNAAEKALYLLPPRSNERIFLGDSTKSFFSLNMSHVGNLEGLNFINFPTIAAATNFIRTGGAVVLGRDTAGGTGIAIAGHSFWQSVGLYTNGAERLNIDSEGLLASKLEDAVTAAITPVATFGHNSTDTPLTNFGGAIDLQLKSSSDPDQAAARFSTLWATATHGIRKARAILSVWDTAEREGLRIEASGSAPMLGVLGASAIVRQAHIVDADGTLADITTKFNSLLAYLENFGFIATA